MAFNKPLNFKLYKKKGQPLSGLCPWEVAMDEGVVLLKGGALCSAYEYVAPDIGSVTEAKPPKLFPQAAFRAQMEPYFFSSQPAKARRLTSE